MQSFGLNEIYKRVVKSFTQITCEIKHLYTFALKPR